MLMLGAALIACQGKVDSGQPVPTDGGTDTGTTVTEPTILMEVAANEYNRFAAQATVQVDVDATVRVAYGEGAYTHRTPAVSASAGEPVEIQVLGLRAGRDFVMRPVIELGGVERHGDELVYSTPPLEDIYPSCTPTFEADEASFDPDEVSCAHSELADGTRVYLCMDYWGEPVFEASTPMNDALMAMRPLSTGGWTSTAYNNSSVVFLDAWGATTTRYPATWFQGKTRFKHEYVDAHEIIELRQGEWAGTVAFLTATVEWLADGSYKLGNGLIVMDPLTEEILYDYSLLGDASDGVSADGRISFDRAGTGDYAEDWTHANSLAQGFDADGREYLLLSLKSQDWVVKLYPDTDEIAWLLGREGDFRLVDDMDAASPVELGASSWFYHQHSVNILPSDDGRLRLLLLDNGLPRHNGTEYVWEDAYSRAVLMRVDEDRGLAELEWTYGSEQSGRRDYFFSQTCGNAQLLEGDDRLLVTDGEDAMRILVAYPSGRGLWRMVCQKTEWCEYRVTWFPSLYERVGDNP